MSTSDLLRYFAAPPGAADTYPPPTYAEWVDDSSAVVVFGSAEASLDAAAVPPAALPPAAVPPAAVPPACLPLETAASHSLCSQPAYSRGALNTPHAPVPTPPAPLPVACFRPRRPPCTPPPRCSSRSVRTAQLLDGARDGPRDGRNPRDPCPSGRAARGPARTHRALLRRLPPSRPRRTAPDTASVAPSAAGTAAADAVDALTWRTTPEERAQSGKGLQLLFRRATALDVKPARRKAPDTPPRHLPDTSETPPRHLADTSEAPPRHCRGTPRHCRDASEPLPLSPTTRRRHGRGGHVAPATSRHGRGLPSRRRAGTERRRAAAAVAPPAGGGGGAAAAARAAASPKRGRAAAAAASPPTRPRDAWNGCAHSRLFPPQAASPAGCCRPRRSRRRSALQPPPSPHSLPSPFPEPLGRSP